MLKQVVGSILGQLHSGFSPPKSVPGFPSAADDNPKTDKPIWLARAEQYYTVMFHHFRDLYDQLTQGASDASGTFTGGQLAYAGAGNVAPSTSPESAGKQWYSMEEVGRGHEVEAVDWRSRVSPIQSPVTYVQNVASTDEAVTLRDDYYSKMSALRDQGHAKMGPELGEPAELIEKNIGEEPEIQETGQVIIFKRNDIEAPEKEENRSLLTRILTGDLKQPDNLVIFPSVRMPQPAGPGTGRGR